jgi:hypothetical protein
MEQQTVEIEQQAIDWLQSTDLAFRCNYLDVTEGAASTQPGARQWRDHLAATAVRLYRAHLDRELRERIITAGIANKDQVTEMFSAADPGDMSDIATCLEAQRQIQNWIQALPSGDSNARQ